MRDEEHTVEMLGYVAIGEECVDLTQNARAKGLLRPRPSELLHPPPHCGAREARQILDLGIGEARANEIADLHLFFSESSEPLCKKTREVGVDFVDGGIDSPPILGSHPLGAAGRLLDRLQHVASSSRKF